MKEQLTIWDYPNAPDFTKASRTPWFNAATNPPPFMGWWECRVITPEGSNPRVQLDFETRRWWDGFCFSSAAMPGIDTHEEAVAASRILAKIPVEQIEYRGLPEPHPEGYTYHLDVNTRAGLTNLVNKHMAPRVKLVSLED